MDQKQLDELLAGLAVGPGRYFERVGSTNDEAARWVEAGAPDLALVVADEQTAGRGRSGRRWFTPPGAALAFSLVLRQDPAHRADLAAPEILGRVPALAALALCEALQRDYSLPAQVKWPNDVLINRRKVCGILAEAHWHGERLAVVILGMGINVAAGALPAQADWIYPPTSVESELGRPVERFALLRSVLERISAWRSQLGSTEFLQAWESRLAFRGEWVAVFAAGPQGSPPWREGQVLGLEADGSLRLRERSGLVTSVHSGEVRLRPIDSSAR